ncbi:potassium voltage-gated channel subfamily KQT member 1-like isoform X8 [Leptopilina boulardi]|uniref:potassium voltage-gated channel subfamily KQT member 1-like isoform X8 n=1 Tax=Leptopilina boulardi TaxID=63433 RepID=UPI0021F5A432|nr:potassium voltage-gated channel subfamily KQT member 1-like isoform X8 [Leptopilina boulardi]
MTSETSSAADSPALLHRPLLTTSSDSRLKHGKGSTEKNHARFSPPSVRFHSLDMDQKTLRSGGAGGRLAAPRMSLLGRPVNYRATRRDARYRRLQARVYNFLERPRGIYAVTYHMIVFCMVFTCLVLSVFSTIDEYQDEAGVLLFYMEMVVVVWFAVEFIFRLWSSGCRSRYQTAIGRLKFLRRPFCIIDVITILASVVVLAMRSSGVFAASALRGLRFFQILRMVRMDRRGGTWKLLGSVVYAHRQELITTLYIGFLGLIFASFLVFLAEKDDVHFDNFAKALWWGVITLCTVGYGDAVPKTWQGKIIASFCALLGISFFALPAGILGSGFALKVQQQQRQKHMIRRRQPAASLIQALWRCYAADEQSASVATWKIHQIPLPSPPGSRVSSSFKQNASFVSRLPTIRRHKSTSLHSPNLYKSVHPSYTNRGNVTRGFTDFISSAENLGGPTNMNNNNGHNNNETGSGINASYSEDSVTETALLKKNSDDEDDEPRRCVQLTNQHKGAIRAIRKLRYFVARKKFREALKPYDVKDVIEQYSSGHADLLNRVRNLQFRLDQILGKQGSKAKDVYASKTSLASRVVTIERQVDDIEAKLDQLLELYMEDRKRLLALPIPEPEYQSVNVQEPPSMSTVLKPILVDKQLSEPSSPTTTSFRENEKQKPRPIHRGHSDLSSRVKKRVTLSSIPSHFAPPIDPRAVKSSTKYQITPHRQGEVVITVPTHSEADSKHEDSRVFGISGLPQSTTESAGTMENSPPSDIDVEYEEEEEEEEETSCENMALLGTTRTQIIVTPSMSPGQSASDLTLIEQSRDLDFHDPHSRS